MARKKKRELTERQKLLEEIKGMSETQLGEVGDLIAGSAQGERIRGLQGTVGVDTAAPSTAFAAKRTLGDNSPDAIRGRGAIEASTRAQTQRGLAAQASANTGIAPEEPQGRLSKLKGLVGGGARAIGGGIKRAANWANQEELGEGFDERKERIGRKDALAAIKPRQGITGPSLAPATGAVAAAPPAAVAGAAGGGEEKTSSQRAAEAAKRAYLAQQERSRGAGGGGGPAPAAPAVNPSARGPQARMTQGDVSPQPPMDQAIRGPAALSMTQGDLTSPTPPRTQAQPPAKPVAKPVAETPEEKEKRNLRGGNMMTPVGPASPRSTTPVGDYPRQPKRNPLTEGSFSTREMTGNQGIRDAAGKAGMTGEKAASQGPQMRAPIKDAGALRPEAAAEQEANRIEKEISDLMKMGGPAAKDRLEEIFGMLQAQEGNKAGTPGRDRQGAAGTGNRAGGRPNQRRLETQVSNRQGGQQLPQVLVNRILRTHGAQWRAIQQGDTVRGTHGGARVKGVRR